MSVNILTKEDLIQFKAELLEEIKTLFLQQKNPQLKKWLRSNEVKKLLKLSPGTLQTLRINGTLTYSRIGSIIFYDYEQIESILQANMVKATKPFSP